MPADVRGTPESVTATVLLPVFNGEKYLSLAIESVLAQSFSDFELLVLNDGSTDCSQEIIDIYAARDNRVVGHKWANCGIVKTLNRGLELSHGRYIIRMDADDICRSDRFATQLRYMEKHPECVVAGSEVDWIDPEGLSLRKAGEAYEHDDIDAMNMRGGQVLYHPAVIIRREALKLAGAYREGFSHAEDLDLFLRLAEVGRVAVIPDVLLSYRQHLSSIGHRYPVAQRMSVQKAVKQACERRGLDWNFYSANLLKPSPSRGIWDIHRRWGWWALGNGNIRAARKHAIRALLLRPTNPGNWRLLLCAVRGR